MAAPQGAVALEGAASGALSGLSKCCSAACKTGQKCCNTFGGCIKKLPATTISIMLRVLNIANAALLGVACYESFNIVNKLAAVNTTPPVTRAFLATYIGVFAAMLVLFETRVKYTAPFIRRNFGFLFTYTGRACFLIFLGAVCFGMLDTDAQQVAEQAYTVCLVVGLATVANAALNCFVICNHPEFQAMNAPESSTSPSHATSGSGKAGADPSRMSDEQIRAYLAAHPEIASQIAGGRQGAFDTGDHVDVPIDGGFGGNGAAVDWNGSNAGGAGAGGAGSGKAAKGFGGFFGFSGNGKGGKGPSGGAGQAKASAPEFYTPPSIPAAAEPADVAVAMPVSYSPQAPAPAAAAAPAASSAQNFAVADEDDNPFATGDNPFGAR